MTAVAEVIKSKSPAIIINAVVNNLDRLARRAYAKRWIVCYSSRTGMGKSRAVEHLAATSFADGGRPIPHKIIRCKQTTSLKALLNAVAYDQMERPSGRRYHDTHTHALYERARECAQSSQFLLVIDEADRLSTPCFETIRDLWDDARLPVLLVGNEDLETIINRRHERLARRIGLRFTQRDLSPAATREVVEFMGFEFSDEEAEKLVEACGGSPGWWEAVLTTRNAIAESAKSKPGMEDLIGALRYFPTLKKQ